MLLVGAFDDVGTATAEEWHATSELVRTLLDGPGHRYLASDIRDQLAIEVSFADPWTAARRATTFELGHPNQRHFHRYGPGFPDPRDSEVDAFVAAVRRQGPAAVERAIELASWTNVHVLEAYAARAAVRVVRGEPSDLLVSALVALAIAISNEDPRDVLPILSLVDDAAQRRQVNLRKLFRTASRTVGPRWKEYMAHWPRRRPALRTPQCMGYQAVDDADGFHYAALDRTPP